MAVGETLQSLRRIQPRPLGAQQRDRIALLTYFGMQPQYALGAGGGVHLDPIDIGGSEHHCGNHEKVDDPHVSFPSSRRRGWATRATQRRDAPAFRFARLPGVWLSARADWPIAQLDPLCPGVSSAAESSGRREPLPADVSILRLCGIAPPGSSWRCGLPANETRPRPGGRPASARAPPPTAPDAVRPVPG